MGDCVSVAEKSQKASVQDCENVYCFRDVGARAPDD